MNLQSHELSKGKSRHIRYSHVREQKVIQNIVISCNAFESVDYMTIGHGSYVVTKTSIRKNDGSELRR